VKPLASPSGEASLFALLFLKVELSLLSITKWFIEEGPRKRIKLRGKSKKDKHINKQKKGILRNPSSMGS
jgi:hypothetical protein